MSEHTPGPWKMENSWITDQASLESIAKIVPKHDPYAPESERQHDIANARLIAAAPELLEALQKIAEFANRNGNGYAVQLLDKSVAIAQAAIAKAEGRES